MAEHMLGLDVGTSTVRVVEVYVDPKHNHGDGLRPTVRVFGQVALPPGAARDGEVTDPDAVGEAIALLWKETGLKSKDVRVGLANQRVVVRTVELPDMPEADLEGAVRFSAQDHIPIPLDEAVLDFAVLERFTGDDGSGDTPMVRVLLAAAHRDPLDRLLRAVAAGGLRVVGVDLVPFALVRALAGEPPADGAETPSAPSAPDALSEYPPVADAAPLPEAIVSIGAGVTTIVVHDAARPLFVRTVATGGESLTAAIADELGVTVEAAEAAKLSTDPQDDLAVRAAHVLEPHLAGIIGEIQGSLNYWMAQSDRSLARVLLTGGGALVPDFCTRLTALLGVPVELARPGDRLDVQIESTEDIDAFLPVGVGLALGGVRIPGRRIDLNPIKPRAALASRRALMGIGAAAAGIVVILGGLTAMAAVGTSGERSKLAAQQRQNQAVQGQIAELGDVQRANNTVTALRTDVQSALTGDVAWTRLLESLAQGMPDGVWLSAFSAQLAGAPGGTPGAAAPVAAGPVATGLGTVSFTASALSFPAVAAWLDELPQQPEYTAVTVAGMTKSDAGGQPVVSFSSTASVAPAAASDRVHQLLEAGR